MRGHRVVLGTILAFLTFALAAHADEGEFPSPVDRIFIPSAFDQGDTVEVILHGSFPNSCYRVGRTGAQVDEPSKTITVWATSTLSNETFCQQTFVSFLQVVNVGVVKGGRYTVVYRDGNARTELDVNHKTCGETKEPSEQ